MKTLIPFALVTLGACAVPLVQPPAAAVLIRMHNASNSTMEHVTANFMGQVIAYGDLRPGQNSQYWTPARAYRYALVEARVNGRRMAFQPQDYAAETPLPHGRYTYRLSISPAHPGNLDIRLVNEGD